MGPRIEDGSMGPTLVYGGLKQLLRCSVVPIVPLQQCNGLKTVSNMIITIILML